MDIAKFKAFCAERTGPYDYMDNRNCAVAQFLRAEGHSWVNVGGRTYDTSKDTYVIPLAIRHAANEEPFTFEALAARL